MEPCQRADEHRRYRDRERNLTLQSGGALVVDIGGTNDYSSLNVGGSVSPSGSSLQVSLRAAPEEGFPYRIINKTSVGAVSGTFAASTVTAVYASKPYRLTVRYDAGDGNDVALIMATPHGTLVMIR